VGTVSGMIPSPVTHNNTIPIIIAIRMIQVLGLYGNQ